MRIAKIIINSIAAIFIASAIIALASGCYVISDIGDTARGISRSTFNADNVLSNYEYFYSTYHEIKSAISQYNNYTNLIGSSTNEDDRSRFQVEQNGTFAYINQMAQQYNARSRMKNRNLFKGKDVPYSIEFKIDGKLGTIKENWEK